MANPTVRSSPLSFTLPLLIRALTAIIGLTCASLALAIPGQPGTLDTDFGTSGNVMTALGGIDDKANAIALQPDGKIVLAGQCRNGTNNAICALRYLANGTPDPLFGTGGKVFTSFGSTDQAAYAVAVQPDGKIVLAGSCFSSGGTYGFCALRLNSNGTLDLNFGTGGEVFTVISGYQILAAAGALQPDGKILLTGQCQLPGRKFYFCALRYNSDGTLDAGFNATGSYPGFFTTNITINPSSTSTAVAVQPDGKIVLAGFCYNGLSYDFCAARFRDNGAIDTSFNPTGAVPGTVITSVGSGMPGSDDLAYAVALQPDGKIVLLGYCVNGVGVNNFCALRYMADGTLDLTFGTSGKVITAIGSRDNFAYAVALQPDGKILLAGACYDNGVVFCALRYQANGMLDTSFATGGIVRTPFVNSNVWVLGSNATGSFHAAGVAIALQADGRIVLAGACSSNGTTYNFCSVRYDGGPFDAKNCSLDIDGDGRVLATTDMLIGTRIALGITGNAVIGGITFAPNASRNTWPLIHDYLITQCGLSLVQ